MSFPKAGPATVHFDLSNRCNTACCTCWHHSLLRPAVDLEWKKQVLPEERFNVLLDELQSLGGLKQVILSGMGEPTLNPGFDRMLRRSLEIAKVTVITNGIRPFPWEALAREIDLSRLELLVSFCGYDEESWRKFHADTPKDGFSKVQETARSALRAGASVKMVQVINRDNIDFLPQMIRLAAELQISTISFKLASLDEFTSGLCITELQRMKCLQFTYPVALGLTKAYGIKTDLEGFKEQLESAEEEGRTAQIERIGCHLGEIYARIDVGGAVYFCCNTNLKLGSILEESFTSLWRGPRWNEVRESLRNGIFFPGCERCGKIKQNLKIAKKKGLI